MDGQRMLIRQTSERAAYVCVQAQVWCTISRARKVVAGMTLVALTVAGVWILCVGLTGFDMFFLILGIAAVVFHVLLPVTVLIINLLVVREVRRASNNAAANLGLHQQSTSAAPTVMLITVSFIYFIVCNTFVIVHIAAHFKHFDSYHTIIAPAASASWLLVFAYNFYVYLITSKQFRSDLRKLFSRCISSCSCSSSGAAIVPDGAAAGRGQVDTAV